MLIGVTPLIALSIATVAPGGLDVINKVTMSGVGAGVGFVSSAAQACGINTIKVKIKIKRQHL